MRDEYKCMCWLVRIVLVKLPLSLNDGGLSSRKYSLSSVPASWGLFVRAYPKFSCLHPVVLFSSPSKETNVTIDRFVFVEKELRA